MHLLEKAYVLKLPRFRPNTTKKDTLLKQEKLGAHHSIFTNFKGALGNSYPLGSVCV